MKIGAAIKSNKRGSRDRSQQVRQDMAKRMDDQESSNIELFQLVRYHTAHHDNNFLNVYSLWILLILKSFHLSNCFICFTL